MSSLQSLNLSSHQCIYVGCSQNKYLISKTLIINGVRCESRGNLLEKKLRILIAGGGIGGLVFALAAKKSGGPIQLLSSALGFLESIDKDVTREITEAGYITCDRKNGIADGITGQWFARFDFLTPALRKRIPVTQIICRMELQRLLLNAVGEDNVMNNSKVVDFVSDADKVTVFLENGEQFEGVVLVGADGLRSMIFVGKNQYFVALDIGKGRIQWYAFVREPSTSPVSSNGNKHMLLELFGTWCDEVVKMIRRTEEETIIRRPIHDIDMISTWGKDRVILLGDAAHAMLPNLGQGGSMAIEDCYWLMLELQNLVKKYPVSEISSDELTLAFRRFEKKRMFRVSTMHSICRMTSVLTALYQTYLDFGPLPLFKQSTIRVKHPAFLISNTLLPFVMPNSWIAL